MDCPKRKISEQVKSSPIKLALMILMDDLASPKKKVCMSIINNDIRAEDFSNVSG